MSLAKELAAAHKARRRRLGLEYVSAGFGYVRPRYVVLEGDEKASGEARDGSGRVVDTMAAPVTPTAGLEPPRVGRVAEVEGWDAEGKVRCIGAVVAHEFGFTYEDLCSPSRLPRYVTPRMIAMYCCWRIFGWSYKRIGRGFGGRDHSTALHACWKVGKQMAADVGYRARVEGLLARLRGGEGA